MSDQSIKTNLVNINEELVDISPITQQKAEDPSLFWGQKVREEVEAHTKTNKYIQELQNILDSSEMFVVESYAHRSEITFKDSMKPTGIYAYIDMTENNGGGSEDWSYSIYGTSYFKGDDGYEKIDKLFKQIEGKCSS